jgi:hypothetical protein
MNIHHAPPMCGLRKVGRITRDKMSLLKLMSGRLVNIATLMRAVMLLIMPIALPLVVGLGE